MTTVKQTVARKRNWNIKMLRGCWAIINILPISELNKQLALGSIDAILEELGAETELLHRQKVFDKITATSDR